MTLPETAKPAAEEAPRILPLLLWGGRALPVGRRSVVMGVLNVTPDSFFDGGRHNDTDRALARGLEMIAQGADVIDVGGESTRPGAEAVGLEVELGRVLPVVEALHREAPDTPISIDTTKALVAERALAAGATVVNDISGLRFEPEIAGVAAAAGAGMVLMHIQDRPRTMQDAPRYTDVVAEVRQFLQQALEQAVTAGVRRESIAIDPGIGFGKMLPHNLALLSRLAEFHELGRPVLVGASRKSFIGLILDAEADQRLSGSLGSAVAASFCGAQLLRVHDVEATVQALAVADAIRLANLAELPTAEAAEGTAGEGGK